MCLEGAMRFGLASLLNQDMSRLAGGSFADAEPELKDKLKKQYVTKEKIAEAPSRIRRIVLDLVRHYTRYVEPNGYKAMLVAPSPGKRQSHTRGRLTG